MTTTSLRDPETSRATGRAMAGLCTAAALMTASMAIATVVGTLFAADRLGAAWGGLPATAGIAGTGLGAIALTAVMRRRGRRTGLAFGYAVAATGAAWALVAAMISDVVGVVGGMLLIGVGNAGAQLTRYAAADLHPAERRGTAISRVVWVSAVGAVAGPLLWPPLDSLAAQSGLPGPAGPFLLVLLATLGSLAATSIGRLKTVLPQGNPMDGIERL